MCERGNDVGGFKKTECVCFIVNTMKTMVTTLDKLIQKTDKLDEKTNKLDQLDAIQNSISNLEAKVESNAKKLLRHETEIDKLRHLEQNVE